MADIIEIIDKIVAISKGIYGLVKNINDAPVELRALDREVSRVIPILEHLFETLGNSAQEEDRNRDTRALQSLCDEARELIDRANGFVKTSVNGTYKLRKIEWPRWLMKKSDREELVKRFHDLYISASAYLSYNDHRDQGQLSGEINAQSASLQAVQHKIQEANDNISAIRQDIARHQEQMHYAIVQCAMRSAAESQAQDLNQHYDQVTTDGTDSADLKVDSEPSTACSGVFDSDRCPSSCKCRCHIPTISLVPRFLRSMAGCVLVQHDWLSAIVSARTPCNDRGCKRHRSNLLKIKYHCPAWFAHINADIRTECIPVHLCIQTQRVVMDLSWLEFATLDTVKRKLSNRELTANDVQSNGVTVLHPLMWRSAVERSETALSILDLLAKHSATMEWEYEGQTPAEFALWWSLVYWRLFGSREAAINILKFRLSPYLPLDIDDAWEAFATKLCWTELHRWICIPSLSMSSTLTSIPPELISYVNVQDSVGRTPLFYAALVSPEAVHALLRAGANPVIVPDILSWAARAGADTVISVLVRAGAHINTYDSDGTTALHRAADPNLLYSIKPFAVAQELVRHSGYLLDWNMRDDDGDTPLEKAQIRADRNSVDEDSKQILELYLTHRLPHRSQYISNPPIISVEDDSTGPDETGLPPTSLIRAGLQGDVNMIASLIRQGAMVNERDEEGRTLLHLVASGQVPDGYSVALQLVRNGSWGVDWKARTCAGETALDIIQRTLAQNGLTETERTEAMKIHALLRARRLPSDEEYIWPCMDPDFYPPHVPGAWVC